MNRTRSYSDPARISNPPAVPDAIPASTADVNQLGIRILGLKSIPLDKGARLTAFFACVTELKNVPAPFLPFIVGELQDATHTLPPPQATNALKALFGSAPLTTRYFGGAQ